MLIKKHSKCGEQIQISQVKPQNADIIIVENNERTLMNKVALFNIGDLVIHKHSRYRAIVVDVDPLFQASGRYNPRAQEREFATRNPWYRLLVDDSSQITYVEECMLIADTSELPINNPHLNAYLREREGHYHSPSLKH